jgi:rubrerythrin
MTSREAEQAAAKAILDAYDAKRDERETHRRAASILADEALSYARANDGESGLVCGDCGTLWNRLGGLRRLADLDCPGCPAIYSSVAHNEEG